MTNPVRSPIAIAVLVSLLCGALSSALLAADDPPTLRVAIGVKVVDVPDTSDAPHGLVLSGRQRPVPYAAAFPSPATLGAAGRAQLDPAQAHRRGQAVRLSGYVCANEDIEVLIRASRPPQPR